MISYLIVPLFFSNTFFSINIRLNVICYRITLAMYKNYQDMNINLIE